MRLNRIKKGPDIVWKDVSRGRISEAFRGFFSWDSYVDLLPSPQELQGLSKSRSSEAFFSLKPLCQLQPHRNTPLIIFHIFEVIGIPHFHPKPSKHLWLKIKKNLRPIIKFQRSNSANMWSQFSMNSRTFNTNKYSQIYWCPIWM